MTFHSEYGEDEWIWVNLKLPLNCFWLDIGCGDPDNNSNTVFLREQGYPGMAIDANPEYAALWKELPTVFHCAVLHRKSEVRFKLDKENPGCSRVGEGGCVVETARIEDILSERSITKVDFISIDIEGSEFDVLSGFNFTLHQPKIIVAEYNTLGIGKDYRLFEMLMGLGYHAVHQTVANIIYTKP